MSVPGRFDKHHFVGDIGDRVDCLPGKRDFNYALAQDYGGYFRVNIGFQRRRLGSDLFDNRGL